MNRTKLQKNLFPVIDETLTGATLRAESEYTERDLPCVILTVSDESHTEGMPKHSECMLEIHILDNENNIDDYRNQIDEIMCLSATLADINAPLSGDDDRPLTGFHAFALIPEGEDYERHDNSEEITLGYRVPCVSLD